MYASEFVLMLSNGEEHRFRSDRELTLYLISRRDVASVHEVTSVNDRCDGRRAFSGLALTVPPHGGGEG